MYYSQSTNIAITAKPHAAMNSRRIVLFLKVFPQIDTKFVIGLEKCTTLYPYIRTHLILQLPITKGEL